MRKLFKIHFIQFIYFLLLQVLKVRIHSVKFLSAACFECVPQVVFSEYEHLSVKLFASTCFAFCYFNLLAAHCFFHSSSKCFHACSSQGHLPLPAASASFVSFIVTFCQFSGDVRQKQTIKNSPPPKKSLIILFLIGQQKSR